VGICILVVSFLFFTFIQPLRNLVGHLACLLVHAIGYFIVAWIVGAIVSIWSPFLKENASTLSFGLAFVVVVLSGALEFSGGHHASGAPNMPSKPSP
jgi:type III secretory pathway component EscS